MQKILVDPESIILYEVYATSDFLDNEKATLIYYGARTKSGRLIDDWCLVMNNIAHHSDINDITDIEKIRNEQGQEALDRIIESGRYVSIAKISVAGGTTDGDWTEVDRDRISGKIS